MKCKFCSNDNLILLNDFYMNKNVSSTLELQDDEIRVKIEVCPKCGLGINTTRMSSDELEIFNKHYSHFISYFEDSDNIFFKKTYEMLPLYEKYIKSFDDKIVDIGCSDGYFMDMLQKKAYTNGKKQYTNLIGIEPSEEAEIGITHGLNIKKDFFKSNYFNTKINIFVLRHVFEHLEEPFKVFEDMVSQLDDEGVIILETPNLDNFCHIHLFYYSWPFYEQMAKRYNMKVIEYHDIKPFPFYNFLFIAFAKSTSSYTEQKCPYTIEQLIEERKKDIADRYFEYFDNTKKLKKFFNNKKKIYWFYTGGYSIDYLLIIKKQNMINDMELIPVSTLNKRSGEILPACTYPTVTINDIKNTHADGIVIATLLVEKVYELLQKNNIMADEIMKIEGFE